MHGIIPIAVHVGRRVQREAAGFLRLVREVPEEDREDFRPSLEARRVEDVVPVLFRGRRVRVEFQERLHGVHLSGQNGVDQGGLPPGTDGLQGRRVIADGGPDGRAVIVPYPLKDGILAGCRKGRKQ